VDRIFGSSKGRASMAQVGYFGVLIPAYDFFQGFYLHDEFEGIGDTFLANVRKMFPDIPTQVRRQTPGVVPEDQAMFGAVSAVLVEGANTNSEHLILGAGWGVAKLAHTNFFMVEATIEKGGTVTEFWPMPAEIITADAAKGYINNLPKVLEIKKRLFKQAMDKHGKKPS
jgi:hypothetical protein